MLAMRQAYNLECSPESRIQSHDSLARGGPTQRLDLQFRSVGGSPEPAFPADWLPASLIQIRPVNFRPLPLISTPALPNALRNVGGNTVQNFLSERGQGKE